MKIGILKEAQDTRVSLVPSTVAKFSKAQHTVHVEKGAGTGSFIADEEYEKEGAKLSTQEAILSEVDIAVSIHPIDIALLEKRPTDSLYISSFRPFADGQIVSKLSQVKCQYIVSLDMIPRTSIAQSMDVLSSMSSIAGYKAVLLAASKLPRYFPMLITSAGSIKPASVLVIGAGVAGLQAIATAKRLGAKVSAVDTRSASKEEVESLGATFLEVEGAKDATGGGYANQQSEEFIENQRAMMFSAVEKADVVVCTAVVRGNKAPVIVTEPMIKKMKAGSVIVDIAASTGGNTALTRPEETVTYHGVTIMGYSNLPATLAKDASFLYSNNIYNFIQYMSHEDGTLRLESDDAIFQQACIVNPLSNPK